MTMLLLYRDQENNTTTNNDVDAWEKARKATTEKTTIKKIPNLDARRNAQFANNKTVSKINKYIDDK